jgi:hypothetical protein
MGLTGCERCLINLELAGVDEQGQFRNQNQDRAKRRVKITIEIVVIHSSMVNMTYHKTC